MHYLLIFLMFFQALGAIGGGVVLMISPSGELIGMPLSLLGHSPFSNFFIPGLFLFLILGVMPLITAYGLLKRPSWKLFEMLNFQRDQHWSWTFSFYTGIILILWIDIQVMFIRSVDILHFIYSVLGVIIIIITQLASVKEFYFTGPEKK